MVDQVVGLVGQLFKDSLVDVVLEVIELQHSQSARSGELRVALEGKDFERPGVSDETLDGALVSRTDRLERRLGQERVLEVGSRRQAVDNVSVELDQVDVLQVLAVVQDQDVLERRLVDAEDAAVQGDGGCAELPAVFGGHAVDFAAQVLCDDLMAKAEADEREVGPGEQLGLDEPVEKTDPGDVVAEGVRAGARQHKTGDDTQV